MRTILVLVFAILSLSLYAQDMLYVKQGARVVIGDTSQVKVKPGYNLFVENGILTEKVKVALHATAEWSDHAFDLKPSISVIEKHIEDKSHLLGMPSASTLVEEGYEITDMDSKLLKQIEWLWLEMIAMRKENQALRLELQALKEEIDD